MEIDEAIEILTRWKEPESVEESEELHEARELGIEALKRLKELRKWNVYTTDLLLPGETKD